MAKQAMFLPLSSDASVQRHSGDIHIQICRNTIRSECIRHKKSFPGADGLSERHSVLNAGSPNTENQKPSRDTQTKCERRKYNFKQAQAIKNNQGILDIYII